jgi:hypothetical protein
LSFLWEQHTAVQNHDLTVKFEHGHIATDFANSAKRNDAQNAWL